MNVRHFKTAAAFRKWLEAHHAKSAELWVGFYHRDSGRDGLGYKEAVDQASCFGWLDGLIRNVDEHSCARRFKEDAAAWDWFSRQPAGYRRVTACWVMGAKQDATRARRLEQLIADSVAGRRIPSMKPADRAR